MTWYYADAGRQVGPVEEAALDDLVRAGVVRDDTLVWRDGMPNWQTARRGPGSAHGARSHAGGSHRRRNRVLFGMRAAVSVESTGDDRQRDACARSASRCICSACAKAARPSERGAMPDSGSGLSRVVIER